MKEKSFYQHYVTGIFIFFFLLFSYLLFSLFFGEQERKAGAVVSYEKTAEYLLHTEKKEFSDLPGFDRDDFAEAYPALLKSCEKILASPRERKIKKIYWDQACNALVNIGLVTDVRVRSVVTKYFEPYLVYDENDKSEGLFTGYYSASLKGSYQKDKKYKYPIYKMPSDAFTLNLSPFADCKNCSFMVRADGKNIVPYYTTEEISKGRISTSDVLLWAENPVDVMILHIQGSGVVTLPDGKQVKINYAGNNGYGFVGIGWLMKSLSLMEKGKGSMQDVKQWLENNRKEAENLLLRNPRYIFFKQAYKNIGPIGSLGVELTPGRSLAVDNRYIEPGSFIWLTTVDPDGKKLERLVTAQDTGAAIRGVIRGDFYFGYGNEAFLKAGRMKANGSYYLLLPKEKVL